MLPVTQPLCSPLQAARVAGAVAQSRGKGWPNQQRLQQPWPLKRLPAERSLSAIVQCKTCVIQLYTSEGR